VLQHLETGDDVEGAPGRNFIDRVERIVRTSTMEAVRAEQLRHPAIPSSKVEEPQRSVATKAIDEELRADLGTALHEVGIDQHVLLVVDVLDEALGRPLVERHGEDETAGGAPMVRDRDPRGRQWRSAGVLTTLVKIHGARERSWKSATLAERRVSGRGNERGG
jgi:hypothetical protein